jgi:hypothetical protein
MRIGLTVWTALLSAFGLAVVACGGSSPSSSSNTTTSSGITSTTTGADRSVCAELAQTLEPVRVATSANPPNPQAVVQAVRATIPQLQALAKQASGSTRASLNDLVNAYQAEASGASGQSVAAAIRGASSQLSATCG